MEEKGGKVKAVVLSQPALPFGDKKQHDAGVTQGTMQKAKESRVPILALRFKDDTISTETRYNFLSGFFGPDQFHGQELPGPPNFKQTWTHRLHAVLTGEFGDIRVNARQTVIDFLQARVTGG